jgi:transcription initiation factor IIE alpha subunit
MRDLRFYCPTCGGKLTQVTEHLGSTVSQPEFEAEFWCIRCQETVYETDAEREDW